MGLSRRLALAVLALLCAPLLAHANLVTNPGFETGDMTGWTPGGQAASVTCDVAFAGSCSAVAMLGEDFSQNLTTVIGDIYTLDFWHRDVAVTVSWNNSVVSLGSAVETQDGWEHFVVPNLTATSTSTPLKFQPSINVILSSFVMRAFITQQLARE